MLKQFSGKLNINNTTLEIQASIKLESQHLIIIIENESIICNIFRKNTNRLDLKLPQQTFNNLVINGNFNVIIAPKKSTEFIYQKDNIHQIFSMRNGYDGFYDTQNGKIEIFGKVENMDDGFFDLDLTKI